MRLSTPHCSMQERRLLERIAQLDIQTGATQDTRAEVLIGSILEHLRRILNTRQGSVPIDPNFGVPDFTNLAGSFSSGSTEQIAQDISRMIERYEVRLKQVQVQFITTQNDLLALHFSISGLIRLDNQTIPVQLASRVAANGKISLLRH